jgi:HAE1 family hydrophobic/amphiphilic exporter-1
LVFNEYYGSREYTMRVWLKPIKMNAYEISADSIVKALKEQNIEAAPGDG